MKIDWFTNQNNSGVITIYSNNITLNKQIDIFRQQEYTMCVETQLLSAELHHS